MRRGAALLLVATTAAACARVPADRYGVRRLRFEGVEAVDEDALRACLTVRERSRVQATLGTSLPPSCGVPPFDERRAHLRLWSWPWTDWPLYDETVFERDLERITRWYRARGYFDAEVTEARIEPPSAAASDEVPRPPAQAPCDRRRRGQGCTTEITITVAEGEPTRVSRLHVAGIGALPEDLRRRVREAVTIEVGDLFDEARYEQSKNAIAALLAEASYARAAVRGLVRVHRQEREAEIEIRVSPGVACVYGEVRVIGHADLPAGPIRAATLIDEGAPYRGSDVEDAQRAVFALGAFSAVEVSAAPSDDPKDPVVPVDVRVTPGRRSRLGAGLGIQAGIVQVGELEQEDVPQWDLHVLGVWEHRNLLGGLRNLRVENRPRLIFQQSFPDATTPRPGNVLSVNFRQPGFLEPRTSLLASARWDVGPNPFRTVFRHDVDTRLGAERSLLGMRLSTQLNVRTFLFRPFGDAADGIDDYHVMMLEQIAKLDLRDRPQRPRSGAYFAVGTQLGGYFMPSKWDFVRLTPEARLYGPLPAGMVLAGRFALGMMFIGDASGDLQDDALRELGPEQTRLRGGGSTSNRGFLAGRLGAGSDGGLRRWEASLELRVPVTTNFGVVLFGDMGDVNRAARFRMRNANTTLGLGLRYQTIVGPIRFDLGWRVPGLQVLGGDDALALGPERETEVSFGFARFPGAAHLTIGDSF